VHRKWRKVFFLLLSAVAAFLVVSGEVMLLDWVGMRGRYYSNCLEIDADLSRVGEYNGKLRGYRRSGRRYFICLDASRQPVGASYVPPDAEIIFNDSKGRLVFSGLLLRRGDIERNREKMTVLLPLNHDYLDYGDYDVTVIVRKPGVNLGPGTHRLVCVHSVGASEMGGARDLGMAGACMIVAALLMGLSLFRARGWAWARRTSSQNQ